MLVATQNPQKLGKINVFDTRLIKISLNIEITIQFEPKFIVHPPTYLNKVLVVGKHQVELWNIRNNNVVYKFPKLKELITSSEIVCLEPSPVLDVIAFALSDGLIIIHNIKSDSLIMQITQVNKPLALSFSKSGLPLLASADEYGNINTWDLNEQRIYSKIEKAHSGWISYLEFVDEMLISGSAEDNSLKIWINEETEESRFRFVRARAGARGNLKKIRYYGENGLHIMAYTNNNAAEIVDFSVINEAMTSKFSLVSCIII